MAIWQNQLNRFHNLHPSGIKKVQVIIKEGKAQIIHTF